MYRHSRREFIADVSRGMLIAGLGPTLAADLGISSAFAEEDPKPLSFGDIEPLVSLLQSTPTEKLLPLLVQRLRAGIDLRRLVSAAALANARTFGGTHYQGYHAFMALLPAHQMAQELPEAEQPLPVLKVLYRNTSFIQSVGGAAHEALKPVQPVELPPGARGGELLHEAERRKETDRSERILAALTGGPAENALDALLPEIADRGDVHTTVLVWRAWAMLDLAGRQHAHTLLRQSVRHCITVDSRVAGAEQVPALLDRYHLVDRPLGTREADDAWVDGMCRTVLRSSAQQAAEAAAAALADGFLPEHLGEAISLAANQLVLRQVEDWPGYYGRRVHGDSMGVHASDTINAWRNLARIASPRNRAAGLIVGAANIAQSHRVSEDRRYRGHEKEPYPTKEHLQRVKATDPQALLRELDGAIRENDQFRACAVVHRYGELGFPPRGVFDVLLGYAVSEDGRLHAEKYYRTCVEEFATTRPAFRWRHLVGLARVTASEFGYVNDKRGDKDGQRAPGYEEACRLLRT